MRLSTPPLPEHLEYISPEWVRELERLHQLASANPNAAQAWFELGMGFEKSGMRDLAVLCYGQVLVRDPKNAKSLYRSGICHWRMGEFRAALLDLTRTLEIEPGYAPAYYRKGTIEMDAGDLDSARSSFTRGTEVGPEYQGGWIGLARVHLQCDEPDAALAILEPMAENDPLDVKVNNLLVTAARQAGKATDREHLQTQILGDSPDPAWGDPWQLEFGSIEVVNFNTSIRSLLREAGQEEQALAMMQRRKREDPEDWSFVELHAQALFELKRVDEARALYRQFLVVKPDDVAARLQLAYYWELEGDPRKAMRLIDEALYLDSNNTRGWTAKGRIFCLGQEFEQALNPLETAYALDPNSTDILYWLLSCLVGLQRWQDALPHFRSYLAQEPEDGEVWLDFARARVKIRAFDKAEEALNRALEFNVKRPKMVEQIRELLDRHKASDGKQGEKNR